MITFYIIILIYTFYILDFKFYIYLKFAGLIEGEINLAFNCSALK